MLTLKYNCMIFCPLFFPTLHTITKLVASFSSLYLLLNIDSVLIPCHLNTVSPLSAPSAFTSPLTLVHSLSISH